MTASEILQEYTGLKKMKRYIIIDIKIVKIRHRTVRHLPYSLSYSYKNDDWSMKI